MDAQVVAHRTLYNFTKRRDHIQDLKNHQPGDLKWSARSTDFKGWMLCDGRALSRSVYPKLFDAVGTSYGNNTSTDFKLPDCRGRTTGACGLGVGLTNRTIGTTVGAETKVLSTNEMPSHSHAASSSSNGSHSHATNAVGNVGLVTSDGTGTPIDGDNSPNELSIFRNPIPLTVNSDGTHSHSITVSSTGNNDAFSIMQPTIFVGHVFIYSGYEEQFADEVIVNGADDINMGDKFYDGTE